MIEMKKVTKRYADHIAVDRLDLTVEKGSLFGFIGPNGAGKTTTIRMLGGLLKPSGGEVLLDGISMSAYPQKAKRLIGFIPDRPYLYEKLTAREFLRFTADLYGVSGKDFNTRAATYLDMFALQDWADDLIESFSHGMKQRLVMASALLYQPRIVIVDEPMVGLDPKAIRMVKELFSNLSRQGVTLFMSTHTLKVAEDICDHIGVINKGRLIATGPTGELVRGGEGASRDLEEVFFRLTAEGTSTERGGDA
jgi:ABC-2 type transport system ATP-binding protein